MISNLSFREVLAKHMPYERLEQAAVPVHVITTELKTGRSVLISSGPAVPALLASTAIPGVFPPVTIGRREFIDGGVANHTPIAAAIELGAERIFVLPVGYPWLRQEPTNALGMALFALARFVEQKLDLIRAHESQVLKNRLVDLEAVAAQARYRGFQGRVHYAEAFEIERFVWDLSAGAIAAPALEMVLEGVR